MRIAHSIKIGPCRAYAQVRHLAAIFLYDAQQLGDIYIRLPNLNFVHIKLLAGGSNSGAQIPG